ncbi:hypothetical protein Pla123a_47770 [Posidoniimonas polymericola]|uniref:Sulfatase n=1 Tax=Posidoniimonas polymericola TaxID=2528002 RepID=A0A5C5XV29_9BACT|nr:DUF1501 domain-containing protein [Posidoniimonas polymericola]TWT66253.1 hypothetical protein Pla123a_47770 [Posidoniimonas polymericola]
MQTDSALHSAQQCNRRRFLLQTAGSLGGAALASLTSQSATSSSAGGLNLHNPPRAKRVIYLFQSGAPSQFESFDYKPALAKLAGKDLPDSVRDGQRLTGMTSGQDRFPIVPSLFPFRKHGESGAEICDLFPHTAKVADDLLIVRSMKTEAINHDPAITFCQTGSQVAGRPSMGAWVAYGLGSLNDDLPSYVVMLSRGSGRAAGQPLYDRLWGSGFLPSSYQGVKLRAAADPVLYLTDPAGCNRAQRRDLLNDLGQLNSYHHEQVGDPETLARIAQYEMAFRMQSSVPDLTDISDEPKHVLDMYGEDVHKPGTYARNCLLARRLAERDVRFIQLYHMGWDQHNDLPNHMGKQCKDTDQPQAALIADLKQRGLLNDTLVVWGGEFGRTVYCQGELSANNYGRDHHPRCFSIWMAGGSVKGGVTYGATDDFSYNIVEKPVEVHDLNATILYLLGIDHTRLTHRFQGRDFRLTDVHGNIMRDWLA